MEPLVRIELTTHALRMRCSTAELQWRFNEARRELTIDCEVAQDFFSPIVNFSEMMGERGEVRRGNGERGSGFTGQTGENVVCICDNDKRKNLNGQMKAYTIFQKADEETISDILDWMRNRERGIYHAAVRELGALKKLRPQYIQQKPLQEQFSFLKKMLSWKPSEAIGDHLLQVWLLRKHEPMLVQFIETLGIEHNGHGIVEVLPETLDKGKLAKAVDDLFAKYPAGVASVYLQMFQLQTEEGWDELADVLANDPRVTIR